MSTEKPPSTKVLEFANEAEINNDDALTVLRTETALSRFPLHRLTKGKAVQIELSNQAAAILWRVDHNSHYGQPGALAYKLDSLYINRRIEESGRPVPKTIRLGSLREIAEEVGSGNNTSSVKNALLQNATASITAKISYRTHNQGERWLEAVFNRYSVVFTGEKLPNGESADAVYLILNDIYQEVLNTAIFRPLDYDYMKSLPPIAQRFYEIVSYQIYAALLHHNPRAKVLYSEYCLLSTATRYPDFDHIKKQMYKVLRPHIQSGYIAKVEYEAVTNERGEPDYCMYLTPGVNAGREFHAFTGEGKTQKVKRSRSQATLTLPFPTQGGTSAPPPAQHEALATDIDTVGLADEEKELVGLLVEAELNRTDAIRFAVQCPDVCRRQLLYLPFIKKFKTSKGAYLRRAIEGDFGPPANYLKAQQAESIKNADLQQNVQRRSKNSHEKARNDHEKRFQALYWAFIRDRVGEMQEAQPEAFLAFTIWEKEQREMYFRPPFAGRPMTLRAIEVFDRQESHLNRFCTYFREQGEPIPTFWEWDAALNTERFQS